MVASIDPHLTRAVGLQQNQENGTVIIIGGAFCLDIIGLNKLTISTLTDERISARFTP
jgi:hypothetical protein